MDAVVQIHLAPSQPKVSREPQVGLREAPQWRYRLRVVCTTKEVGP